MQLETERDDAGRVCPASEQAACLAGCTAGDPRRFDEGDGVAAGWVEGGVGGEVVGARAADYAGSWGVVSM